MIQQLNPSTFINLDSIEYGMGIFETMLVKKSCIYDIDAHLKRLNYSLQHFGVKGNVTFAHLEDFLKSNQDNEELYVIKLIAYISGEHAFIFLKNGRYRYDEDQLMQGFKVKLSSAIQSTTNELNYHKTINYFERLLLLKDAKVKDYDEIIRLNEQGFVTEGAKSNVFIKNSGIWYTPPLESGILPGIARGLFIDIMKKKGLEVVVKQLTVSELLNAQKIALTNSLIGFVSASLSNNRVLDEEINQLRREYFRRIT